MTTPALCRNRLLQNASPGASKAKRVRLNCAYVAAELPLKIPDSRKFGTSADGAEGADIHAVRMDNRSLVAIPVATKLHKVGQSG
ncbi:hypothetical protein BH11PSE12_BH11PSE12_25160 [soil metagenome]